MIPVTACILARRGPNCGGGCCRADTEWLTPRNGPCTFPYACGSPAIRDRREPGASSPVPGSRRFMASTLHADSPEPAEERDLMTATLEPTTTPQATKPTTGAAPADVIRKARDAGVQVRSEEHTSELQSRLHLVCRLLLEKKKKKQHKRDIKRRHRKDKHVSTETLSHVIGV